MDGQKSKAVAYFLAIFLGGFGAHLFYVGKYKRAVLYLVFFWTYVPFFFGWIDLFFISKWIRQREQLHPITAFQNHVNKKLDTKSSIKQQSKQEHIQVKKPVQFFNESLIILEKYAHLRTPRHILDGIESVLHPQKNQYRSAYGIAITVSYSRNSDDFFKDSIRFAHESGSPSQFYPLKAYWTTFDQLDEKQKKWYFYWRNQCLNENYLDTDLSYLILFTYELINYSFNQNAAFNVSMLVRLYEEYKDRIPNCKPYLSNWIHDFLLELDEVELASEWGLSTRVRSHTLFDKILEKEENLESISITLWKPFITGYRETEFFRPNKNRIYKVFKESVNLLQKELWNGRESLRDRWFEEIKGTEKLYLFRSAVIGRNIEQREKMIEIVEFVPKKALYDDVTNLFRLAENVTRTISGEKRQIKVNEDILPDGLKEKMIEMFSANTTVKKRFKKVQDKTSHLEGSVIPQQEEAKVNESNFTLDLTRVEELQKASQEFQTLIEDTDEFGQPTNKEVVPNIKEANRSPEIDTLMIDFTVIFDGNQREDEGEFIAALSAEELEFLKQFEDNRNNLKEANQWMKSKGIMPGMFISSINEKAQEFLNDNLIEMGSDDYELYEEFEYILANLKVGAP